MMSEPGSTPTPAPLVDPGDPRAVGPGHVLCVTVSMKPAPGRTTPSACRNLLTHAARRVAVIYPAIGILDLREVPLPWFDGRPPGEMHHPVGGCHDLVARSGALFLAIPAYWCAVSASFKNFVEVLSGPAYDGRCVATPFVDKPVGYFVVGADERSAVAADGQARAILQAVGARLVGEPVVLGNPAANPQRLERDAQRIIAELGSLVQRVAETGRRPG